ncbi:hypothetical protein PoB_005293100 [Plakobranchus ocellatus]|uniref:Uncharacterized protein n=1 Tax=Plakobranchus ocellatus TaxID=259542 RepID=A0AAV4BTA7_9GAST|nr:hypothetical protein PoB_005293100 [Plakobranchus ocellatus]
MGYWIPFYQESARDPLKRIPVYGETGMMRLKLNPVAWVSSTVCIQRFQLLSSCTAISPVSCYRPMRWWRSSDVTADPMVTRCLYAVLCCLLRVSASLVYE